MSLTSTQLTALRNNINADPTFSTMPLTSDASVVIANSYNQIAVPDYWVWRTRVMEREIYEATSPDGTTWDWSTYIAQSAREADAWERMFAGGFCNPSLAQTRAGIAKIFSGTGASVVAQRAHLLAMFRRLATRGEKVFAVGAGTTAAPSTLGFEGTLSFGDIDQARAN